MLVCENSRDVLEARTKTLEPVMSWKPKALLSLFSDFSEKSETQKQSVVKSTSKVEPYQPFCSITDAFKRSCTYLCASSVKSVKGFYFVFAVEHVTQ